MPPANLLRLYLDADVLFRAATPAHDLTATLVTLTLAEQTLIQLVTTQAAVDEAQRNLLTYRPDAQADLAQIVNGALRIVELPPVSLVTALAKQADPKDMLNLAASIHAQCHILLTFNVRDYAPEPSLLRVMTPGQFVVESRMALLRLAVAR